MRRGGVERKMWSWDLDSEMHLSCCESGLVSGVMLLSPFWLEALKTCFSVSGYSSELHLNCR